MCPTVTSEEEEELLRIDKVPLLSQYVFFAEDKGAVTNMKLNRLTYTMHTFAEFVALCDTVGRLFALLIDVIPTVIKTFSLHVLISCTLAQLFTWHPSLDTRRRIHIPYFLR